MHTIMVRSYICSPQKMFEAHPKEDNRIEWNSLGL